MFDHAQSPRLGQRTAVENPGVQLVTLETLPEVAYRGQIVYLLDENQFRVYDGVAWQHPGGASSGGQTFVSPTPPVADAIGDLWLSTTDYQLRTWDGDSWELVISTRGQLTAQASLKLAQAIKQVVPIGTEAQIVVSYMPDPPSSPFTNDFWVNTVNNTVHRWDGTQWSQVLTVTITKPIIEAGLERSIADMEITLYYDSVAPVGLGPADIGDVWTDTGNDNLVMGWTGAIWVELQVTAGGIAPGAVGGDEIAEDAIDAGLHVIDGTIITSKLSDYAITTDKIADYAVPVFKLLSTKHEIF